VDLAMDRIVSDIADETSTRVWIFCRLGGDSRVADVSLRSLAPEYQQASHASYVRHLNEAVTDSKARNIALAGRYGSGKSSILDRFLEEQSAKKQKTLRISINTLGPADDDDITNRIQKELVKQLVYRAEPGRSETDARSDVQFMVHETNHATQWAVLGPPLFMTIWVLGGGAVCANPLEGAAGAVDSSGYADCGS
jgi:hypothetical protein